MEKETPLLNILERVPIAVFIVNPVTAKILWVNGRLTKMYGVSDPHAVIGKSMFDFVDSSQTSRALADLGKLIAGRAPEDMTYRLRRANGESAAGQVSATPMTFRRQLAVLGFIADVSERESLLQRLSESEARYRRLLEVMPSGVAVIDEFEKVAFVNPALVKVSGFDSAKDLLGHSIYQFIADEDRPKVREFRNRLLQGEVDLPAVPVTLVRPDGVRLETSALNSVINWKGQAAIQSLLYDVGLRPEVVSPE